MDTKEGDYQPLDFLVTPFVEVSIIREAGTGPIKVEVFGKIADILISIAEDNPTTILFYFCDIVEGIPHPRTGRDIPSHECRNYLFKLLFQRYREKASEHWSDIEVILRSQEPLLEMYAHFLIRDRHLQLVELLRKEVLDVTPGKGRHFVTRPLTACYQGCFLLASGYSKNFAPNTLPQG